MSYTPLDAYKDAVDELAAVGAMWNPFQLVYVDQGNGVVNQWEGLVHSMQEIGIAILVLMAAMRFIKTYMDELHGAPALSALLGIAVEVVLCAVFLLNYTWFAEIFPSLFNKMTQAILNAYDGSLMNEVVTSLGAVGAEKAQDTKWFSLNALSASIPNILSTAAAGLSLALYFVMSRYQALLYTFWYLIGPLLLPFYLFPPFRGVAERWFSSLLGSAFMGVVGALMFVLMAKAQWLTKAFGSGENASYITALVFSLLTLLLMISIPRLSHSIWDGISTSMTHAMATGGMVGGVATRVTLGGAGAMAQVGGSAIRGGSGIAGGVAGMLRRYGTTGNSGMSQGQRILDALRNSGNRDAFANEGGAKVLRSVYDAGAALSEIGRGVLMSQMPSAIARADKAVSQIAKARKSQKVRRREEDAVKDYVVSKLGPEAAKGISFPERWRLPRRVGQSLDDAVAKVGEGFVRSHQVEDLRASIRREAAGLAGDEAAKALLIPKNFKLKVRRTGTVEEAIKTAALGLLRKQGATSPEAKRNLDNAAIKNEAVRILGAERGAKVVVPPEWAIIPRKGQSQKQALEGSTRALLQRQGLIDKKDENQIALRYRFAKARTSRKPESSGGTKDAGTKSDGGKKP